MEMMWKKLFWILAAILPFSFALNPSDQFDLQFVRLFIPIIFLFWLFFSLSRKKIALDNRLRFGFLGVFIFLTCISFFWSIDSLRAIRKILFLLSILPIYFVSYRATQTFPDRMRLFKILAWSTFCAALFALGLFSLQFIVGIDPAISFVVHNITPLFLGNNFSEVVMAFPSWLVNINGMTILRTFGTFPDPHLFSLYANLVLPLVLYLFVTERKKIYIIIVGIILLSSLMAFSRAAYLSLIAGLLFLFISSNPYKSIRQHFVLIALGVLSLFYLVVLPNPLTHRLSSSFDANEGSNEGRIEMWQKGYDTLATKPLSGVGIGNFSRYINPQSNYRDPIYAHNLFLDFGAEVGIFGLLSLLLVLASPIVAHFKKPSILSKFVATAMIILVMHSLFETPFYSVRVFPLILILLSIHADD